MTGEIDDHDQLRFVFEGGMVPTDEEFKSEISQQDIADFKQTTESSFLDIHRELGQLPTGCSFKLIGMDFEDSRENFLKIFIRMETPWKDYGHTWFRDYTDVLKQRENDQEPEHVEIKRPI